MITHILMYDDNLYEECTFNRLLKYDGNYAGEISTTECIHHCYSCSDYLIR